MKNKLKTLFLLLISTALLASCAEGKNDTLSASDGAQTTASQDASLNDSPVYDLSASEQSDEVNAESDVKYTHMLGMKKFVPSSGTLAFSSLVIDGENTQLPLQLYNALNTNTQSSVSRPATVTPVLNSELKIDGVPAHLLSQAYIIEVGDSITVTASTEQGIYYGVLTVSQYMQAQGAMAKGFYTDWPDVSGRVLHIDLARKYLPKDWIISTIKSAAAYKINEVELHFSENEGFRIECETDPAIVSKEYLTKAEVREIIDVAKQYFVEIVPSFDSPGHLKQILAAHPEYQLVDVDGYRSSKTLDFTNPAAVNYIKSLLDEYAELFKDCKYFNIGGDESFGWSDISRMQFAAWKVLNNHAKASYGEGANAHDSFIAYINNIASHMESKGFKVRAWNDGLIRNKGQAKVQNISTSVDVCYWSDSSTLSAARVESFVKHGSPLYNVNEQYMYYVLKEDFEQPNAKAIFDEWNAGVFCGSTVDINSLGDKLRGAYFCIWCDRPDVQTTEQITQGTYGALRAMAVKSWNSSPNISFSQFNAQIGLIK